MKFSREGLEGREDKLQRKLFWYGVWIGIHIGILIALLAFVGFAAFAGL